MTGHASKLASPWLAQITPGDAPVALHLEKSAPVSERKRFKQTTSLKDRLAAFAEEARGKAKSLHGAERDELLRKARRADTAAHIDDWMNSSELQPPK